MTLTEQQMLARWMLHRYNEPLRCDAMVTRTDGIDLQTMALDEMRAWYLGLLDSAPPEVIPASDITALVSLETLPDGSALMSLPPECRRLVSVSLDGWARPAEIVADPSCALARRQHNPMTRGGTCHPVAVVRPDRRVSLHTPPPGVAKATEVLAVMQPADGTYILTPRALTLIPKT